MNILLFVTGLLLFLSPIIGLVIYIAKREGGKVALIIFGSALGIVFIVSLGIFLISLSGIFPN